jgi:hypothetical protein
MTFLIEPPAAEGPVDPASQGRFLIEPPEPRKAGTLDRVRAGAAGVNKGFYSDLLGLPVDTAVNIIDLVKAGVGTVAGAAGRPDLMPEISDRAGIVGSSAWLEKKINEGGLGGAINNPNPEDGASRVLHMGGRVAGASIVPNPKAQISGANQIRNILMGEAGGLTAGTVGEVKPEWAGVAGMVPQLAAAGGIAATRQLVHGGEPGRKVMEQRLQDFQNAGVDNPSLGLATGNKLIQGAENILSVTPGSVGVYERNKNALLEAMRARTGQIRDQASTVYGPEETGMAIQADLKGPFKERIGNTYGRLNDRVEQVVGADTPVPVTESVLRSGQLTTPIPGAEATSSNFINPRIAKINRDLATDSGGRPAQVINSPIVLPNGQPAGQAVIPAVPPQGVPFSALKELRTKIGKEAASNAIMGTPEQADFKQLYGGMSQDMKNGVAMADLQNGTLPTAAGSATTALNRANTYYSRAMNRADELNPIANRSTPEKAYDAVAKSLESGPTVYERLRGAVTPETRQKVVATVIDEMGMAKPGQQGADGDAWSPSTFLTNYNRLDPKARTELFKRIPGGEKLAADLHDVAKAADMVNQGSKVWANPSGTTAAAVSRGTLWTLTAGAFFQPLAAGVVGSGLLLGNQASQRLLLNPTFVGWLAKAPKVSPAGMQSYAQMLIANANKTNDQQFKRDVAEYLALVNQGME